MIVLRPASSDADWREVRSLLEEYQGALELDLGFQDFATELETLPTLYGPPDGTYLLAEDRGRLVGGIGLRRHASGVGEIKRLYVRPIARHCGAGRSLITRVIEAARAIGFQRLILDTLPDMNAAQRLYRDAGFATIEPYRFNPVPGTQFLGLTLTPGTPTCAESE